MTKRKKKKKECCYGVAIYYIDYSTVRLLYGLEPPLGLAHREGSYVTKRKAGIDTPLTIHMIASRGIGRGGEVGGRKKAHHAYYSENLIG